jgi:hypothetical protein
MKIVRYGFKACYAQRSFQQTRLYMVSGLSNHPGYSPAVGLQPNIEMKVDRYSGCYCGYSPVLA